MNNMTLNLNDEKTLAIITQFAEGLPGGFFIYHADGAENFIYVNSAMLRIFGCETEEEFRAITKNSFHTMVHPDDIDAVEKSIASQIEQSVYDLDYVEYRIIRKDGKERWIVDYGHFVHTDVYGDVFFVFIDDATEVHQLETEEKRKNSVIEGLSNGFNSIYLINVEADMITPYIWNSPVGEDIINETFHNKFSNANYTKMNADFSERYILKEDQKLYLEMVNLEYVKRKIVTCEEILHVFRCKHKDGNPEYVQISISAVHGSPHLAVMGIKTVTEQMRKIQSETVERLRIERERDEAIHANNAKSIFLFNMSHDLKTPINAIIGFAELARKNINSQGDKEKLEDYLEKIGRSSELLVHLINDILSMTEIESGNLVIKEAPCNLSEQIILLGDIFRPQMTAKNLHYSVSLKITHNEIIGDSLNLKRILSNILQNAVSYTQTGGEIAFEVLEQAPSAVHPEMYMYKFVISDNGCGMSKEFLKKMFTSFEREQNTTTSTISGTGLGLTITKNIVEAMHGNIKVHSKQGEGSRFIVTIPFKAQTDTLLDGERASSYSTEKETGKNEKRVLLVEDNDLNREIAEELLRESQFLVESASDGQEAVELFSRHSEYYFDLILMDIQMPRMDGYEATSRIRSLARNDAKTVPIYAITANTLENDKVRAYESGMDYVIEKPISIELFQDLLKKI